MPSNNHALCTESVTCFVLKVLETVTLSLKKYSCAFILSENKILIYFKIRSLETRKFTVLKYFLVNRITFN